MQATESTLEAFMNGFEFVLLAMEGRIATENLSEDDRARLQVFLDEYWRVAKAFRARKEAPGPALAIEQRVKPVLEPVMAN